MPKLASSSVSSARMTVPAEALIDSPTRTSACSTAVVRVVPWRISSRTRKTRNSP